MSNQIPIFKYPGGGQVPAPTENVIYKWIDPLGGGILPGPITWGTVRPDGDLAHGGALTIAPDGTRIVEYHDYNPKNRY